MQIQRNKVLAPFSTFGIGGPAAFFTSVQTVQEMQEAFEYARLHSLKTFVLGKGSNTLFSDKGFDGLVIQNKIDFLQSDGNGGFTAGSGCSFALLGQKSAREGFKGLEFAAGIPATVGGAIFMNAGAQKQETQDSLVWVDFMNSQGSLDRFDKASLEFSYRHSSFQKMQGAIVQAFFQTTKDEDAYTRQKELVGYRIKTQPYRDKSCGCIFRNPEGFSAGALIDKANLKGFKIGGAEVSKMHANFIVNADNAKAEDVLALMNEVQSRVEQMSNVLLESEVRVVEF